MRHQHKENIAIIGVGPRGVSLLERFAAQLSGKELSKQIHLHLFEKTQIGCGVHETSLPDYILLNTIASQITVFPDPAICQVSPIQIGPSLYEWAVVQGYQWLDEHIVHQHPQGKPLSPNDYLPRRILGLYLKDMAKYFIKKIKLHHRVTIYKDEVCNISKRNSNKFMINTRRYSQVTVNKIIVATGHPQNIMTTYEATLEMFVRQHQRINPHLKFVYTAYPLRKYRTSKEHPITIAIQGMGLTAIDVLMANTVGLGGRFVEQSSVPKFKYIESGREPKIIMYSLDGLPLAARAENQKSITYQYQAHFLTIEAINALRKRHFNYQLDFDNYLLPLLLKELEHVYYTTWFEKHLGENIARQFSRLYVAEDSAFHELICMVPDAEKFNWQKISNPLNNLAFASESLYQDWLISYLENDIQQSHEGNLKNPLKAACDSLRDLRDNIRYAIDHAGLTPESHQRFLHFYGAIFNRISVGPPRVRIAQLLALIQAGVVDISLGPKPVLNRQASTGKFTLTSSAFGNNDTQRTFDVLIIAKIPKNDLQLNNSLLYKNLVDQGIITPFQNADFAAGGIQINHQFNPIDKHMNVVPNLWFLGCPVEGQKYYTYILPRTGVNSTAILDAATIVSQIVSVYERENYHVSKAS